MKKIGVIGLGYVGLPLALLADEKGFGVVGVDLDKEKIQSLKRREAAIDDQRIGQQIKKTKIVFTDDFSKIKNVDIAIICVPTPVDKNKSPDLSIVKNASLNAAKHLKKGSLLIIESTINPGVCNEVIIPLIEEETSHKIGKTLHVAHCPERINPGDPEWHVGNINRVLGADSEESLDIAYSFYTQLVDAKIKKMGSIKEAEAVKIVENTFRDVNIAFVNELAMSFEKLGININNVIDGAATKPFAFMAHYPGIGVGGHCIPVDPYYLIEYARGNGFEHKFLSLARSINESMPTYAVNLVEETLIKMAEGTLQGKTVAVLGLSYKANVRDDRESPSYVLINQLEARGAVIRIFDPYFPEKSDASTLEEALLGADVSILVTGHQEFASLNPSGLSNLKVFLDGRNVYKDRRDVFTQNGIYYLGIGV